MRNQQNRLDNASRAAAKLAELQARGLCAPPPEPSAAPTTTVDHQSLDAVAARSARAQVVGVIVPAYLSLEELIVKSGVNTLQEVALSMPPMPLHVSGPRPASGKEQHRRNDALASAAQRPLTDTVESNTCSGTESAGWGTETTEGPAAAVAAALAAMRGVAPARQAPDAAINVQRPPKLPPPGFAAAGSAGTRVDADPPRDSGASSTSLEQAQSNSAPTSASASNLTGATMLQTQTHVPAPSGSTATPGPAAGASGAVNSVSTGKAGATDATSLVGAQRRSCPTPPRTPQPLQPSATTLSSHALAASTMTGRVSNLPALTQNPPPPVPLGGPSGALGAMWPGLHTELNGATTGTYQANPYGMNTQGHSQTYSDYSYLAADGTGYYEQRRRQHNHPHQHQQHSMYAQLPHMQAFPSYTIPPTYQPGPLLSQPQYQWAHSSQLPQSQQHHPPQSHHFQSQEPHQPPGRLEARGAWQQSTVSQQPCTRQPPPPPPVARPLRPPVQPQSMAPVSAVFGSARFEAVMSVLRRTLTALYSRNPDIFREVYGFDLNWWISTRGKPLGEDDLLTILPFRDYVLVVVRKYGGFTQHVNGGRKLWQLAANPVLSALLSRPVCGNALVLRLRMDFADPLAGSSRSTSAAGNSSSSLAGEACGGGGCDPVDHVCGVSLSAACLRNVLLETETLAWHVEEYKAFLEDIDDKLVAEAQVGWVARLPRTSLDERGMPKLPEALKAAATATGLAPSVLAQALAVLTTSSDICCDGKSGEGAYSFGSRDSSCEGAKWLSNGCTRSFGGNHRVGQSAAVPEALLPLLRCVRCSSPWCDPATSSGSKGVGACPFGHIWRNLDPESDGDSPLPVFTVARPGVLTASIGASAATRGPCPNGRSALSVRQLVPQPCGALVARLSVYWHWHRSKNLKLLVAAALDERLVEMEAVEAAQAAARALGISARHEAEAAAMVDGCLSSSERSMEESQEAKVVVASDPTAAEAAKDDNGKNDMEGDDDDGEEKYRRAAKMLRHETWPYYLSFCKGPDCMQCHSGHEVRLATAVQRLLGRAVGGVRNRDAAGLVLSTHSLISCSSAAGAHATANGANPRLGFEVLAEFDEDASRKNATIGTRAAAVGGAHKSASKKASNGPIDAKPAVVQKQQSGNRARANDKRAPEAASPHQPAASVPVALSPVADSADAVKMSWADEAEAAEAEVAAAVRTAAAHCSRKLLGKSSAPPLPTFFPKPSPIPKPPPVLKSNSELEHHLTTLEAPASCTSAPSPTADWHYDARPLPELPDHLDDDVESLVMATKPHDTTAGMDVGQTAAVPARAAVTVSMAIKSRNGVYVPPHLRSAAGDGGAEQELSILRCQKEEEEEGEELAAQKAEVPRSVEAAAARSRSENGSEEDGVGGTYVSSNPTQSLLHPPGPPRLILEPTALRLEPTTLSDLQQGQQGAALGASWMPSVGPPTFMPGPNMIPPYAHAQLDQQLPCPPQPLPPQPLLNPLSSTQPSSSAAGTPWGGMPPHHLQSTGPFPTFAQGTPPGFPGEKNTPVPADAEDDLGTLLSLLVPSAAAGPAAGGLQLYTDIQGADVVQHGSYGGPPVGGLQQERTTTGSYAMQPPQQAPAVQPPQNTSYPYSHPYTDPYSHTSGCAALAPDAYGHSLQQQPPLVPHFPSLLPPQQHPPLFYAQGGFEGAVHNSGTPPAASFGPASFMSQPHLVSQQRQPSSGVWPGQLPPPLGPPIGLSTVFGDQYGPQHSMHSTDAMGGGWDRLRMS